MQTVTRLLLGSNHMKNEHLPGPILGDARHQNRVVGAISARRAVDPDIGAVRPLVDALTSNKCSVRSPVDRIVVLVRLLVPIAVDKPLAVGRKRNITLGLRKHLRRTQLTDDSFLLHVIENLPVPFSANDEIALRPLRMPADELLVQRQPHRCRQVCHQTGIHECVCPARYRTAR